MKHLIPALLVLMPQRPRWPANPITKDGLSRGLPKVTKRLLGVARRPHAFRHVAATSIAETDPAHVGIIKDLCHATLDMSEKH